MNVLLLIPDVTTKMKNKYYKTIFIQQSSSYQTYKYTLSHRSHLEITSFLKLGLELEIHHKDIDLLKIQKTLLIYTALLIMKNLQLLINFLLRVIL